MKTFAITGGMNGYPEPELGEAMIPENFEELDDLRNQGGIVEVHWRDGWHFAESRGPVFIETREDLEDWYYDRLSREYFHVYKGVEDYIEGEMNHLSEGGEISSEELKLMADKARLEFANYRFIAGGDGVEYEGFNPDFTFYADTHHFAVAVFVPVN